MELLGMLIVFIGTVGFFVIPIGLIRPSWVRMKSRKQVLLGMLGSFVLVGVGGTLNLPPSTSPQPYQPTEEVARSSTAEVDRLKAELAAAKQEAADAKAALDKAKQSAPAVVETIVTAAAAPVKSSEPETLPAEPLCELEGKVISIADGDTITVLSADKVQHKIRFSGIDAPEKGQPFSQKATKYLNDRIGKQTVCVEWNKTDKYGRKVGVVKFNDEDINYGLVKAGLAWHYKKYQAEQTPKDRELYAAAELTARSDVIGLWSEPDPIEPGEWRAGVRPNKAAQAPIAQAKVQALAAAPAESGYSCGTKRFCKQMESCAEACHYLTECGLNRLDRDSDGIPCESICGKQC